MPVSIKDLNDDRLLNASRRVKKRIERVQQTKRSIKKNQISDNETDSRIIKHRDREGKMPGSSFGHERSLGEHSNLLDYEFLEQGFLASQSVACVEIDDLEMHGTGFLVAPNILLTNHHVIPTKKLAMKATAKFGFESDNLHVLPRCPELKRLFDPEIFFATNKNLDYTFVFVDTVDNDLAWLPLIREQGKIVIGQPVNIIQHPNGDVKQVTLHNSYLLDIEDNTEDSMFCWYSSDTDEGSSGAPVFNNRWEIVALHHKAVPKTNKNGEILDINGQTMTKDRYEKDRHLIQWIANEGVRVSRIVEAFENEDVPEKMLALRNRIAALWNTRRSRNAGLKTGWLKTIL